MPLTLTRQADSAEITLPEDLVWTDEFAWSPVSQAAAVTLSGALVLEEAAQLAGRPITLGGDGDGDIWADRATVEQLRGWAAGAGTRMTLDLGDGRSFDVAFRYGDGDGPVSAAPVVARIPPADTDPYTLTLRFLEV